MMEALCIQLANQDPRHKEEWRAKAKEWHQRAGRLVMSIFGHIEVADQPVSGAQNAPQRQNDDRVDSEP